MKRILHLAGYDVTLGRPKDGDLIGVWGKSPTSPRGEAVADKTGQPILRVEDAFLRSLFPGRDGEPPIGLMLDHKGVHFDASQPSDLETLLATHPLDDTPLLNRAREGIARLRDEELSKYSAHNPDLDAPEPGYVLVIDQTKDDASIRYGGANEASFKEMLYYAQTEHPTARILLKTHPETMNGHRLGHFGPEDQTDRIELVDAPISPWKLLDGAIAVYVVSSQLGFEAILAGHKPIVFGQPFYAGWGLSEDRNPIDRRQRQLTRAQLFAGAMLLYPTWYDPCSDRLTDFEGALNQIAAQTRAWRQDRLGWQGQNIRLWKRAHFQRFFGQHARMRFKPSKDRPVMHWGRMDDMDGRVCVEDGFLRSSGLGAELVPPMSLVLDDKGIYFDPTQPSRLEDYISKRAELRQGQTERARQVIRALTTGRVSKYNLSGDVPDLPEGRKILVPGQVEDDASVQYGCGDVRTNLALLQKTRAANPDAVILYKPHPDVEAGLRQGAVDQAEDFADLVLTDTPIAPLLDLVDEVWTMTSLTGFEALLRGVRVTTLGAPFYAGWGLTEDLGKIAARRTARPTLEGLVHASLIDYPRYFDPISGQACAVETVIERLANGPDAPTGIRLRLLSKLQGILASQSWIWR